MSSQTYVPQMVRHACFAIRCSVVRAAPGCASLNLRLWPAALIIFAIATTQRSYAQEYFSASEAPVTQSPAFQSFADSVDETLPLDQDAQDSLKASEGKEQEMSDASAGKPEPTENDKEKTDSKDDAELTKSLQKRLEAIEKELKKAKDAEQKKKDEDAGKPTVKPRGRLHLDANWFHQSDANRAAVGDIQDGTYIRRARLGFDAKAFEVTEYRLDFEMGSGGGRPSIFDAYGKVTQLPLLGNVQLGHFREPFSLEAQTSSNWMTFIERSTNAVFDPARNWGLMIFDHNDTEDMTWAMGVFREGSDNFGDDIGDSGERAVTSRVTWLPYYDEPSQGRYFFELGASYSYRDPDNRFLVGPGGPEAATTRYFGAPENLANEDGVGRVPFFIDISIPDATDVQLIGLESSWNIGALNLQSEFIGSYVDRFAAPSCFFHGAYVQASYFLTGECRQWDRKLGYFGRAQVFEPFFRVQTKDCKTCTSRGAWEVAVRWNYLNLSDENINGGYLDTSGIGLNWYLSPYMRMMFDYNLADLHDFSDGRSDAQVFSTRLDVHF